MNLKELHELARYNKDFDDFKAKIDEKFNGTPTTVVDKTEYKLVKNLGLADVGKRIFLVFKVRGDMVYEDKREVVKAFNKESEAVIWIANRNPKKYYYEMHKIG